LPDVPALGRYGPGRAFQHRLVCAPHVHAGARHWPCGESGLPR
jgi:hypothetical protein